MKNTNINFLEKIYEAIKSLGGSVMTAQSDWNEADNTSPKYIANKPVVPVRYEVENITGISGDILTALKCGDQVVKITGVQKHLYTVSYKGEGVGEGICLTYVAAGLVETVSYDYTDGGWVYNSTDITPITT